MIEKVQTENAPKAIGPYSQAIKFENLLFTSGQIPLDPETNEIIGKEIQAQTKQVMENLKNVLKEAGTNFDNVLKTTCFLSTMDNFVEFNEVYAAYIQNKPARSCVAVKTLPKNVLCEVELIVAISK